MAATIESVLAHFAESEERLSNIQTAELREAELNQESAKLREEYLNVARQLHEKREQSREEI